MARGRSPKLGKLAIGKVPCPSGPRGRSAKPLFGGSNPPGTSISIANRMYSLRRPILVASSHKNLAKFHPGGLGVIEPPPIFVSTPVFDGSLAMLFTCVRDHKVNLLDVPLFPICEAYFHYLMAIENKNLDESAAALGALAYLLERKAWLLLPTDDPEPMVDDPLELPAPTAHEFQAAIEALSEWHEARRQLFFRSGSGPDPYELPFALEDISAVDLAREFERILREATPEPFESPSKPRISLQEQMRKVLLVINYEWQTLSQVLPLPITRNEAVYWFLALLELLRLGQIGAKWVGEDIAYARR